MKKKKKKKINNTNIFQQYLVAGFQDRLKKDNRYNLAAYSRDLKILPSKLSNYLNGTGGLSVDKAKDLAMNLGLSGRDLDLFLISVEATYSRSDIAKKMAQDRLNKLMLKDYEGPKHPQLALFSDWYSGIILIMTQMSNFVPNLNWIANKLNIDVDQVSKAVQVLANQGLLILHDDKWIRSTGNFQMRSVDVPNYSAAIESYVKIIHNYVNSKLKVLNFNDYESEVILLSGDENTKHEYMKIVEKFRAELFELSKRTKVKDKMYILNFVLCPVFNKD